MLTALMSIQPFYATQIFNRTKKWELRRSLFTKNRNVEKIVIYVTSPTQRIMGEFSVTEIVSKPPDELWDDIFPYAGIDQSDYKRYFNKRKIAHAIKINELIKYTKLLSLSEIDVRNPPQSFLYLTEEQRQNIVLKTSHTVLK